MSRDRYKEDRDFKELTSVNSDEQILGIKEEIGKLIPPDIKIIAKNKLLPPSAGREGKKGGVQCLDSFSYRVF